jgi:hypothetical protein
MPAVGTYFTITGVINKNQTHPTITTQIFSKGVSGSIEW